MILLSHSFFHNIMIESEPVFQASLVPIDIFVGILVTIIKVYTTTHQEKETFENFMAKTTKVLPSLSLQQQQSFLSMRHK